MKLKELLDIAAKGYGDFPVKYDDQGHFKRGKAGDTLAEFIVAEITDTYDPDASGEAQLDEAHRVLDVAVHDLECVLRVLEGTNA